MRNGGWHSKSQAQPFLLCCVRDLRIQKECRKLFFQLSFAFVADNYGGSYASSEQRQYERWLYIIDYAFQLNTENQAWCERHTLKNLAATTNIVLCQNKAYTKTEETVHEILYS